LGTKGRISTQDDVPETHAGKVAHPPPPRRKLSPGPGLAAQEVASHQLARIRNATIEIVAEQGYQALKVRDIVGRAEVSTRAFYEHFSSKEDCFLQTHEFISRRANRRIIAAQAGERDWRKRPRLILDEFVQELEKEPAGARVALLEAYAASADLQAQARRAERIFEGMLAESLARPPSGVVVSPLIVEGIVAGIAGVSKKRLLTGKVAELSKSSEKLIEWVLSYPDPNEAKLAELDRQSVWRDTTLEPLPLSSVVGDGEPWPGSGDRGLILRAVADLAPDRGYAKLTAARVRSAAGVSRKEFEAHFDGLEDCYLAALEQRAREALTQASRAQAAARSWPGGVYRAIAALCAGIASDAFLAKACFTDDFPPGENGARSRRRLIAALTEQLSEGAPQATRPTLLEIEASAGAVWAVFRRHATKDRTQSRQIAATLSYLALAPTIGASATITAIQGEQSA
jgi:AcrR family transcriptional regulator